MELSSPRFKAVTISAGFSFWFFIIANTLDFFTIELFAIFVGSLVTITQILAIRVSKILDSFAIFNTKIFLSIFFLGLISLYGIFFRALRIDLLRLKKNNDSYWLDIEIDNQRIEKQY
jgi:hypothetical protein|tara:strand:+ start:85 stop:438 length:354 start_codon:yes stop_codon:yes gene_type:complete